MFLSGSRDGAVVIALASYQCGPGSNPGPGVTSGLSLLLVLVLAPRVFLRVLRFSGLFGSLPLLTYLYNNRIKESIHCV